MKNETTSPQTIDDYIAGYPENIQVILNKVRGIIREVAPQATEAIKYGLPTFVLDGNLVHFGAFKKHIGFYPAPSGIEKFEEALAPYARSKGAIQFPLDQPIPYDLITEIVRYRVMENQAKAAAKKGAKKAGSG